MDASTKVFLCTDTLVTHRSYYVVARSRAQAEDDTHNILCPVYLEEDDSHQEYQDTMVNEEVETIFLVRKDSPDADPPQIHRLIPTAYESESAYRGYLVADDTVNVSLEERIYPKAEWHLYQQSTREG